MLGVGESYSSMAKSKLPLSNMLPQEYFRESDLIKCSWLQKIKKEKRDEKEREGGFLAWTEERTKLHP